MTSPTNCLSLSLAAKKCFVLSSRSGGTMMGFNCVEAYNGPGRSTGTVLYRGNDFAISVCTLVDWTLVKGGGGVMGEIS